MNLLGNRKGRFPMVLVCVLMALALSLYGCNGSDSESGDTTAPTTPTGLQATAASAAQIDLTWAASTDNNGVTGYKIFRDGVLIAKVTSASTTSYSNTGLAASTTYNYQVCAYDAAGNDSARSAAASATTLAGAGGDTEAPTTPANLVATATSATTVDLAWDASTDNVAVTGYKVYRDGVEVDTSATNSYSDSGLTANTDYSYEVSAVDAAGNESAKSTAADVTTPATGLTQATNVFLDAILPDTNYTFLHGSTSPDGTKMFLNTNEDNGTYLGLNFKNDLYMVDATELEKGNVSLIANSVVSGDGTGPDDAGNATGGPTIGFRSSWSPDGSKIALAAADRVFILDSTTLQPLNGANGDKAIGGQNHDALFTSDGNYVIMTLRSVDTAGKKDGFIQLYDVNAGQAVGNPVSVCNSCHGVGSRDSVLCGLDGVVTESGGTYSGTVYVAGHGGHFAKVDLSIDPSNTTDPITLVGGMPGRVTVSMVKFAGGDSQYKLHDARLDTATDTLYWSTYNTDADGKLHYGKVDLGSSAVTDVAVDVDARATIPGPGIDVMPSYCASGQTANYFMPMTMTRDAYITVIPKSTITASSPAPLNGAIKAATNVVIDDTNILPDNNYTFLHGSTSPDRTKMFLNTNEDNGTYLGLNFNNDLYMVDAAELEKGNVSLIANSVVSGDGTGPDEAGNATGGPTIGFRSSWSPDGSKIALAAADRVFILDSTTLQPLNGANGDKAIGGQNHDALFTSDGNYAILTLRSVDTAGKKDGFIQLYDVNAGQAVGNPVSVCNGCHGVGSRDATLCGLDGVIDAPGYGSSTYTGTVFVAGHGGHIAKVDLSIDPTNTTDPIAPLTAFSNLNMLNVSSVKFGVSDPGAGTSQYKLHDVRLDGTVAAGTLYWSTYNTDANGQLHYGKVDLGTSAVTDVAVDVDAVATIPDRVAEDRNVMPMYCASGQTDKYFMPMTMTRKAYITVIPKLTIK